MHKALVIVACALAAQSAAAAPAMTRFSDPTEHAFEIQVPSGWKVKGGIQRFSQTNAGAWVTAASPDGKTFVFVGDPSLPMYEVPNPGMMVRDGTWTTGVGGLVAVTPYLPGQQFAALYGRHAMGKTCSTLQWRSGQNRPDLAEALRQKVAMRGGFQPPGRQNDAGAALFSCTVGGKPYSASVTAVTVMMPLPGGGGIWFAQSVYGFRTPSGNETQARSVADTMHASFKADPQWEARMGQAIQQRGADMREAEADQAARFSQQLAQQGRDLASTMASRQNAYMDMMSQQEEDRNNAFNDHMRAKAWGQFNEMLYINDQHCMWNDDHTKCLVVHN
jgi:hypothetical protein